MSNDFIKELNKLEEQTHQGRLYEVMYRIGLWGEYFAHFEIDNIKARAEICDLIQDMYSIFDKLSLNFVEGLVAIYTYNGFLSGYEVKLYTKYQEYFDRAVRMLLGQETWTPPTKVEQKTRKFALIATQAELDTRLEAQTFITTFN